MTTFRVPNQTLAACLTPPGTAAIATLGLRGPDAWNIAQKFFGPLSKQLSWPPPEIAAGQFWPGRFGKDPAGSTADEVVLAVVQLEPVPSVELHCHGGREVLRWLLEILAAEGVRVCSWRDLERATAADSLHAEAAIALADAPTPRTAAILLDQYHGALRQALDRIVASLHQAAHDEACRQLEDLGRQAALGRHLSQPWRVAILGAPNVGKSSLVNALAGYARSVVAPTPGTTRDVVTTSIAVGGWPVELADTAGLREHVETLEGQGIERAQATAKSADLCVWVLDASQPPVWPSFTSRALRLVINKMDLPAAWDLNQATDAVRVSAQTGEGVSELAERLGEWLVPNPPLPGAGIPFTPALAEQIEQVNAECRAGRFEEALHRLRALG